jgi:hypothetical protein
MPSSKEPETFPPLPHPSSRCDTQAQGQLCLSLLCGIVIANVLETLYEYTVSSSVYVAFVLGNFSYLRVPFPHMHVSFIGATKKEKEAIKLEE